MPRPLISIVYNTSISVVKFRLPLIAALQRAGYDVVVIAPPDHATPVLADHGIPHRPINMSQYGMNPIAEIGTVRQIRAILQELRPVASLHYTVKPNTFGNFAARLAGVPVLNNIAGAGRAFSGGNPLVRMLAMQLYRFGLKPSHTVFFQNADDHDLFRAANLVNDRQCVRIPGSGVDLARISATALPDGPVRFLFVGRLLKAKGITEFLEAANLLLQDTKRQVDVRVDVVGEMEDSRGFIKRAELERLTNAPQISYHGRVAPDQVAPMIRSATCVVLPSYYGEGVPRVLLEACASGRPIITTDNVGCRDVVEPGQNGWMVPPRDHRALAKAMQACADTAPEELAKLGAGARRTAETRFDEQIVIDAYLRRLSLLQSGPEGMEGDGEISR